jgi:hypothetical protein
MGPIHADIVTVRDCREVIKDRDTCERVQGRIYADRRREVRRVMCRARSRRLAENAALGRLI